jgi:hypothetical protein
METLTMLELLNSMVRLSAAVTVFGMQEVQSAVGSADPTESVDKLRAMIDSMANAVSSKIDESKRPTLDSFSSLGKNVVDRTVGRTMDTLNDTLNVPSMSPKDIVQSTSDAVKSTSDWLGKIVKPAAEPAASEPKVAEEALAG